MLPRTKARAPSRFFRATAHIVGDAHYFNRRAYTSELWYFANNSCEHQM